jgi:hypothetical protein
MIPNPIRLIFIAILCTPLALAPRARAAAAAEDDDDKPAEIQPDPKAPKDSAEAKRLRAVELLTREYENLIDQERATIQLQRIAAGRQTKGAYLGVAVESPTPTLRAQLRLPEGAGLVVNYVDPAGPSKDGLKVHDVLQRFDDQILINGEQLVALVHMRKAGETVQLTVIREARPVTVTVALSERDPPAAGQNTAAPEGEGGGDVQSQAQTDAVKQDAVDLTAAVSHYLPLKPDPARPFTDWFLLRQPAGVTALSAGPVTFSDGENVVKYWVLDGGGILTAVDAKTGKLLFQGQVGTEAQWKAVPENIRQKLDTWVQKLGNGVVLNPSGKQPNDKEQADQPKQ